MKAKEKKEIATSVYFKEVNDLWMAYAKAQREAINVKERWRINIEKRLTKLEELTASYITSLEKNEEE